MKYEQINARYAQLCSAHSMDVVIASSMDSYAPKYTISEQGWMQVITLNQAKIPSDEYERYLAWAVAEVLLPRLVLHTDRLTIRRFAMEDAAGCFAFMSDVQGMLLDGCKPFAAMDAAYAERMRLFEERTGQYVIVLNETDEVIGTINVFADESRAVESREIGYAISPAHQRKGYASEAVGAMCRLLQEDLMIDMVVAGVLPENLPSIRLLEKLGFTREGMRHKALWHEALDRPVDLLYYYKDREAVSE